jgi:hypothetical protein
MVTTTYEADDGRHQHRAQDDEERIGERDQPTVTGVANRGPVGDPPYGSSPKYGRHERRPPLTVNGSVRREGQPRDQEDHPNEVMGPRNR